MLALVERPESPVSGLLVNGPTRSLSIVSNN